jgi:tRNA (guanine-N7-)-methyltransferase
VDRKKLLKPAGQINPYFEKIWDFKDLILSEDEIKSHKGHWHKFAGGKPLYLDIGCGNGELTTFLAEKNPNNFYIGVERQYKEVYRTELKIHRSALKNVKAGFARAEFLPNYFEEGELNGFFIFFPDPWPKRKQKKNRIVTREYVRKLVPLVKSGGLITLKTDNNDYFMQMLDAFFSQRKELGIEFTDLSRDFHVTSRRHDFHITAFERIFIKQGCNINFLEILKK